MSFPTEIRPLMKQLMTSPKFIKQWNEHIIREKWDEWVGKRIAQHIRPGHLRDNRLAVIIDDEKWIGPFQEFEDKILEKMACDLGSPGLRGFTILREENRPSHKGTKKKKKGRIQKQEDPEPITAKPDLSMGKEIEETLSSINDPKVREALKHLITKSLSFDQQ